VYENIAVIGYGVIGKRVADAINYYRRYESWSGFDIISDWRIQNSVQEYDILWRQPPEAEIEYEGLQVFAVKGVICRTC